MAHCYKGEWLIAIKGSGSFSFSYHENNNIASSPDFTGAVAALGRSLLGRGSVTTPIHLDEVTCVGSELALSQCYHSDYGIHDCSHAEDAGVICESKCVCVCVCVRVGVWVGVHDVCVICVCMHVWVCVYVCV